MTTATLKGLKEKRLAIGKQMNAMVEEAAKRDKPGMTAEEDAKFTELDKEEISLRDLITKTEKREQADAIRDEGREQDAEDEFRANPKTADDSIPTQHERDLAMRAFCVRGNADIPDEWRNAAKKCGVDTRDERFKMKALMERAPRDMRHLKQLWSEKMETRVGVSTAQTITTTGGGHIVPNDAMREIEIAMLAYGGVRESGATIWRTSSGATMPCPTMNDTTNKSVVLAINTAADVEALVFGQTTMTAFMYTTNMVLVPLQLFMDSAFDVPSLVGTALGERAGRGTNTHFTVGVTSDTQPSGIVTESIVGVTGADVASVTYAELVRLQHSVDPEYRKDPSCGWMLSDGTLSTIKRMVDGSSRPLWLPALSGLAGDFPDTILGKRYTINQDMASIASATTGTGGAKAILFGAMNRYKIRDVMDFTLLRLNERFAEKAQVAFLAFHRHDGKSVIGSTGTPPIRHFITKST